MHLARRVVRFLLEEVRRPVGRPAVLNIGSLEYSNVDGEVLMCNSCQNTISRRINARVRNAHQSGEQEQACDDGSKTETEGRMPMTALPIHKDPEREDIEDAEGPEAERFCEEEEELFAVSALRCKREGDCCSPVLRVTRDHAWRET